MKSHFVGVKSHFDPVKRFLGLISGKSEASFKLIFFAWHLSMDALAQSITSADRGTGSVGPVSWGPIPADGDEWNIALHHMVSYIFGDGLLCGSHKPQWYCDCAEYFLAGEEERRGLPRNSLSLLSRMPYLESVTKTEYAWGKKKAFLFGVGEQFGQWEAYWCVYIKGDFATGQVPLSMEVGQIVLVGGAQ